MEQLLEYSLDLIKVEGKGDFACSRMPEHQSTEHSLSNTNISRRYSDKR